MPNPTKIALAKHPKAVVLLACMVAEPTTRSFDYEWFNTGDGVAEFVKTIREWADEDVTKDADLHHLIAEIEDAQSDEITVGKITVHSPDPAFAAKWLAEVEADTSLLIAPAPKARKVAAPKVKPHIKGLKPGPAGAALQAAMAAPENAPKPKAAKVRKPGAKAEAEAPAIPAKGAAALKARLAAKQANKPVEAVVPELQSQADLLAAVNNVLKGADPVAQAEAVANAAADRAGKAHVKAFAKK